MNSGEPLSPKRSAMTSKAPGFRLAASARKYARRSSAPWMKWATKIEEEHHKEPAPDNPPCGLDEGLPGRRLRPAGYDFDIRQACLPIRQCRQSATVRIDLPARQFLRPCPRRRKESAPPRAATGARAPAFGARRHSSGKTGVCPGRTARQHLDQSISWDRRAGADGSWA